MSNTPPNWKVEKRKVRDLIPYSKNPRKITPENMRRLKESLGKFGLVEIPVINIDGKLIAGHQRCSALILMGQGDDFIDVRIPDRELTESEFQEYNIRSNINLGDWATDALKELGIPMELLQEVGLPKELLVKLNTEYEPIKEEEENVHQNDFVPIVKEGDMFQIGRHRLICGDATKADTLARLMGNQKAQMIITDPPYNVKIDNIVNLGKTKHREFTEASGEMSEEQFTAFLQQTFANLMDYSIDGSMHYIFMDWRHALELLNAAKNTYGKPYQRCTWKKDNAGMGTFYRSQHEDCHVFKNGTAKHINNFELGQHGRYRTNIWEYPGANSFSSREKPEKGGTKSVGDLEYHPTPKPIAMIADAILDCSNKNGLILDVFGGSGTTMRACQNTDRVCYMVEKDPHYIEVIIRLFAKHTKKFDFHHLNGGLTLKEILQNDKMDMPAKETI